jgi:hypothetical protein
VAGCACWACSLWCGDRGIAEASCTIVWGVLTCSIFAAECSLHKVVLRQLERELRKLSEQVPARGGMVVQLGVRLDFWGSKNSLLVKMTTARAVLTCNRFQLL